MATTAFSIDLPTMAADALSKLVPPETAIVDIENPVSVLQILSQRIRAGAPVYEFGEERDGSKGQLLFRATVTIPVLGVGGVGNVRGGSKAIAKKSAARACIFNLRQVKQTTSIEDILMEVVPELRKRPAISSDDRALAIPECNAENPFASLAILLHKLGWAACVFDPEVVDHDGFRISCVCGPPHSSGAYHYEGKGVTAKKAKKNALAGLYANVTRVNEVLELWNAKSQKKVKLGQKLSDAKTDLSTTPQLSLDQRLQDALKSLVDTGDLYQNMEFHLHIVLAHLKRAAIEFATFLEDSSSPAAFMKTSAVLPTICRKLLDFHMEVSYEKGEEERDDGRQECFVQAIVSWKEIANSVPKRFEFIGTGADQAAAKEAAAEAFFFHFGIHDDDFKIPLISC